MKIPAPVQSIWDSLQVHEKAHKTKLHCAVLLKRNKVLAVATNRIGSRSQGCGYSDRTIHAERNVIKKLGDLSLLRGCTLFVSRIGPHAHGSKPCSECVLFLEKCMDQQGLSAVAQKEHVDIPDMKPQHLQNWDQHIRMNRNKRKT